MLISHINASKLPPYRREPAFVKPPSRYRQAHRRGKSPRSSVAGGQPVRAVVLSVRDRHHNFLGRVAVMLLRCEGVGAEQTGISALLIQPVDDVFVLGRTRFAD